MPDSVYLSVLFIMILFIVLKPVPVMHIVGSGNGKDESNPTGDYVHTHPIVGVFPT